jgi:hypothetical protein
VGETKSITFPEGSTVTDVTIEDAGNTGATLVQASVSARAGEGGTSYTIKGTTIGSVRISAIVNGIRQIIIASVVPAQAFYEVPASQVVSAADDTYSLYSISLTSTELGKYKTEPTYRLAWRWRNQGDGMGASGDNGGIDILGKGDVDKWVMTTYYFGGWFYDLNGVQKKMNNGVQSSSNGVTLTLVPSFVYDKGVPYLQIKHELKNTSSITVTDQKFGATADVMMWNNDYAPLKELPYGALMVDSDTNPTIKLRLVCQGEELAGIITPTDTLWLGAWGGGNHLNHVYDDKRDDVTGIDSAIAFSYKNIELKAGETKKYIIRFTLVR